MAATRIIAVGRMTSGDLDMTLLNAIDMGRFLFESGASKAACLNVDEEAGWLEAAGGPADGWLQETIDYAAELEALQDGMEDESYWRSGQW